MQTRLLTTGAAAHLLTKLSGRDHPYGPGVIRYYEAVGRLPAQRTSTGVRLFKEPDVRRLATELARQERYLE